jgi:uncharacterized protein (TIGR03437 family)
VLGYTVDPSGLAPGIYAGRITVKDSSGNQVTAAVALALSQSAQSILLSQSGMTFNVPAGGTALPPQSFSVLNTGGGSMGWTASAATASGGAWLSASPASGSSAGGQPGSAVNVSVNAKGLAAGQYYGSVTVASPNATNSPESVSVLLNVGAASGGSDISLSQGAAILSGAAGSTPPRTQQISLFNAGAAAVSFSATAFASNGGSWLSVSPASGSLTQGGNPLTIAADLSGLAPGVQTGTIRVAFEDGTVAPVTVVAIATGGGTASIRTGGFAARPLTSGACAGGQAGYLVAAFAEPLGQAALQPAVAQPVRILMADDCGKPVSSGGGAQVMFANASGASDAPIVLQDAGGGVWEGTWTPVNPGAQVTLTAMATEGALQPATAAVTVSVASLSAGAAAQPTGVVNAAGGAQATPGLVTPGSFVAIYGTGLAAGTPLTASATPFPATLNGTQVLLGGEALPLYYAGAGQINGLIPQALNPDTSYELVVERGTTQSVPVALTVAPYQPGIFTADTSGSGQGAVEIAGTALLAAPAGSGSRPVQSGSEYLAVYCTGLGPVTGPNGEAPPADGAGAPLSLVYRTVATLTATIGGMQAPVVFAGLTPGAVELYQVNVQVPAGVPTGGAVPLVLTLTDPVTGTAFVSNTVTVAVQ